MLHNADEYDARSVECERLAGTTRDTVLREQLLSLSRIYRDYAGHLRARGTEPLVDWRQAVNQ